MVSPPPKTLHFTVEAEHVLEKAGAHGGADEDVPPVNVRGARRGEAFEDGQGVVGSVVG